MFVAISTEEEMKCEVIWCCCYWLRTAGSCRQNVNTVMGWGPGQLGTDTVSSVFRRHRNSDWIVIIKLCMKMYGWCYSDAIVLFVWFIWWIWAQPSDQHGGHQTEEDSSSRLLLGYCHKISHFRTNPTNWISSSDTTKYRAQPLWVRFWDPKKAPSSCTHLGPAQVMEVIIIDV